MPKMKKLTALLLTLTLVMTLAACGQKEEKAAADNKLTVGTVDFVKDFAYVAADGTRQGYEIDLMQAVARQMYGEEAAVEFVTITTPERETVLDKGTVDAVIATYSITPERQEKYNISQAYYTDHVGVLVRTDSTYTSFADLDGTTLGVLTTTTSRSAMEAAAAEAGIKVEFTEFNTYDDIIAAMAKGSIQGFTCDISVLALYRGQDMRLLPERFAAQDCGIVTAKTNTELAAAVDKALGELIAAGTIAQLQLKWGIAPVENYAEAKIGVVDKDSVTADLLLARLPKAQVSYYDTVQDGASAVESGAIAALASDQPLLLNMAAKSEGLVVLKDPISTDSYSLAVAQGNTELAASVNDLLKTDGLLDEMTARWFPLSGTPGPMPEITNEGKNGTLILAAYTGVEPFCYKDGEAIIGYDVELAARVAAALGKTLEIKDMGIDEAMQAVAAGEADLCCGCLTITAERSERVLFCDADYLGGVSLLVKQN